MMQRESNLKLKSESETFVQVAAFPKGLHYCKIVLRKRSDVYHENVSGEINDFKLLFPKRPDLTFNSRLKTGLITAFLLVINVGLLAINGSEGKMKAN